jgi:hypothetical protein
MSSAGFRGAVSLAAALEIDDEVLLRLQDGLDAEAIHLNRRRAGGMG